MSKRFKIVQGPTTYGGTYYPASLFLHCRSSTLFSSPEVDMVLPDTPDTVKADAVASLTLPEEWTEFLDELHNEHVFSWAWCERLIELPASIVTLGFEARVDDPKDGSRHVQLTMFSSQLHRRSLGLENGPVFGAILNENTLELYVSYWENDTVVRIILCSFNMCSFYVGCTTGE